MTMKTMGPICHKGFWNLASFISYTILVFNSNWLFMYSFPLVKKISCLERRGLVLSLLKQNCHKKAFKELYNGKVKSFPF